MRHVILAICLLLGACHQDNASNDPHAIKVPEPGAFAVLGVGLIATVMAMRSKK